MSRGEIMNVKSYEDLYYNIEQDAMKKLDKKDLADAVSHAIYENFDNKDVEYLFEFAKYLDFFHGNSIKVAYEKGLGDIAKIDYEILKQTTEIAEREQKNLADLYPKQNLTKREEKYFNKLNKLQKKLKKIEESENLL